MSRPKNVVVAQSGGPTPVINNSLRGVIETCKMFPDKFNTVYAGFHGVEGILKEELLDLSAQSREEIALLRTTPAAGSIGTCRYKLKSHQTEDFERLIEVFKAHDIGYLFYIGGNDSMDTANKISILAREKALELIATVFPRQSTTTWVTPSLSLSTIPRATAVSRDTGKPYSERERGKQGLLSRRPGSGYSGHGQENRVYPGRRTSRRY